MKWVFCSPHAFFGKPTLSPGGEHKVTIDFVPRKSDHFLNSCANLDLVTRLTRLLTGQISALFSAPEAYRKSTEPLLWLSIVIFSANSR